jgi:hypothetical protein
MVEEERDTILQKLASDEEHGVAEEHRPPGIRERCEGDEFRVWR